MSHFIFLLLWIFFTLHFMTAHAESNLFQNSKNLSSKNIEFFLQKFTKEPHPMGSPAQKKISQAFKEDFSSFGLDSYLMSFNVNIPNYEKITKNKNDFISAEGINIVAINKGTKNCAVVLSGHYDTKYFKNIHFIGANDGGSSTALLLELARIVHQTQFKKNSIGACSLYFVLFDGEESFLPNWNDGAEFFNQQDNLYGSRFFASIIIKKNKLSLLDNKNILFVLVLDMVGHINQNLFITQGSNKYFANKLIQSSKKTKIKNADIFIEDDHVPFLNRQIPVVHVIDWANLNEWHTQNDSLNSVSVDKIAQLGEEILEFLIE